MAHASDPSALPIVPEWPAPAAVGAAMSTRLGAVSGGPQPVLLSQVHGTAVVRLQEWAPPGFHTADASLTTVPGVACTVRVADCLPVLLCDHSGTAVAAAHAGWRGLAAGVLDNTVRELCEAGGVAPEDLMAWLGPCIGPQAFEVGPDVLEAFGLTPGPAPDSGPTGTGHLFRFAPRADGSARWRADLAGLAEARLSALGLRSISRHGACTVADPSRFFSFRRDGQTGRMAASIWLR